MKSEISPEPIQGNLGGTDPGPRNIELDRQNPDILTPPSTDHGTLPNLKFSFGMAHNRLQGAGWARQVTIRELPAATTSLPTLPVTPVTRIVTTIPATSFF